MPVISLTHATKFPPFLLARKQGTYESFLIRLNSFPGKSGLQGFLLLWNMWQKITEKSIKANSLPGQASSTIEFSSFLRSLSSFQEQHNLSLFLVCSRPCSLELPLSLPRLWDLDNLRPACYDTTRPTKTQRYNECLKAQYQQEHCSVNKAK